MDNISNQIGALELGDNLGGYGDGALEAAGEFAGPSPVRTTPQGACWPRTQFCISDSALEAAGANVAIGPSVGACRPPPTLLRCVSDSALERAADTAMSDQPPLPTAYPGPRCF